MILSILGVLIGIGAVLVGNALEGGHLSSLIQPTAAMIVFGGTAGCVLLGSTMEEFVGALKGLKKVFLGGGKKLDATMEELLALAGSARREGLLSLDSKINSIQNPFLKTNLRGIVDGYDPNVLREMMEDEIHHTEETSNAVAKVWEDAGAYSPTIGILGAVLGLIHVMSNLSDPSKLGAGIAVAFVATVYGVGTANLLFLPIGKKLKKVGKSELTELVLMKTALVGIQNGLNPRIIEAQMHTAMGTHGEEGQSKAA